MITKTSLKVCFPEYDGPDGEARPALEYIQERYRGVMEKRVPGKSVNIHVIAARVRMDMKVRTISKRISNTIFDLMIVKTRYEHDLKKNHDIGSFKLIQFSASFPFFKSLHYP
jgi:hypothetical protein